MSHLQMSAEDRAKYQAQAALTKESNKKWALANLRDDLSDKKSWQLLGQKYGVRLPQWYIPSTETKYIKRTLKTLGVDSDWWVDHTGCTFKEFSELNPTWPAYAQVGIALETYDMEKQNAI